jgi:CBS domain-containing protein
MNTVKDIMTRDVDTATPDMTVREAAQLMKVKDIGSLPVCEGRRVIGVVTDRDIAVRVVAEGLDLTTRTSEIMSKDVVTVREDADLKDAERLMHDRQIRRLPIVDARGELTGYLAMARVAREESSERAGKVIKGVSQPSKPEPMEAFERG